MRQTPASARGCVGRRNTQLTGNAFIDAKLSFSDLNTGQRFGDQAHNTTSTARVGAGALGVIGAAQEVYQGRMHCGIDLVARRPAACGLSRKPYFLVIANQAAPSSRA